MLSERIAQITHLQDTTLDKNLTIYGSAVPVRRGRMPGEDVTKLHPDDAKALQEREEMMKRRQELHALAFKSGVTSFQGDIEPPGGYETTGQPGDLIEGIEIEIEEELRQIA